MKCRTFYGSVVHITYNTLYQLCCDSNGHKVISIYIRSSILIRPLCINLSRIGKEEKKEEKVEKYHRSGLFPNNISTHRMRNGWSVLDFILLHCFLYFMFLLFFVRFQVILVNLFI